MKIVVCVKIVDGECNPFDESAIEAALRIPDSEVYVVSMCPASVREKLLSLTRLGVKEVYLLSDKVFAGSDTLATSYVLSKQIKELAPDLILCGRQTIDGDTAQVGPCLAIMLGVSLVTNVMEICQVDSEKVSCNTRLGREEVSLPALLTIERIHTLRFPSIRSKVGELRVIDNQSLGCDVNRCGLNGSPTRVLRTFENQKGFRKCKWISPKEFPEIVQREREKQIGQAELPSGATTKLGNVFAVGKTVSNEAMKIAESVTVLEESDAKTIAGILREKKPSVVLWNGDLWGRRTAPQVAAMLETGLCADCTRLETDGKKLFMYRPARAGNVIAKIECKTLPQMATVRCGETSDTVFVSAGRGVIENLEEVQFFAKKIGAEFGASRPVVDINMVPYEAQVGLTGKAVSPKVYVAIGISGAVQHACAIENAGCVIAINPDRNAPIFQYADYGIVDTFAHFIKEMEGEER